MLEKSIKPQLDGQLEARPIAMLVQVASQYDRHGLSGNRRKKD